MKVRIQKFCCMENLYSIRENSIVEVVMKEEDNKRSGSKRREMKTFTRGKGISSSSTKERYSHLPRSDSALDELESHRKGRIGRPQVIFSECSMSSARGD